MKAELQTLAKAASFCSNVLNKHCGVDQLCTLWFLDGKLRHRATEVPASGGAALDSACWTGGCVGKELIYMATLGKPLVFSLVAVVVANVLCSSTYQINRAVKETVALRKPAV